MRYKRKQNGQFLGSLIPVGVIDDDALERAFEFGIDLRNGHVNIKDGRVRLFCKSYPGSTGKSGYCLRSRLIWWLYTGEILVGCKWNLHHKNHNRVDDRFGNLEKILHVEHSKKHNPIGRNYINCICKVCKKNFTIDGWRSKEKTRGTYCSQKCYHSCPIRRKNHSRKLKLNARKRKCQK